MATRKPEAAITPEQATAALIRVIAMALPPLAAWPGNTGRAPCTPSCYSAAQEDAELLRQYLAIHPDM